ncbi:MAG: hypothetical protein AB2A00_40445 [Myxococcota bacterium]
MPEPRSPVPSSAASTFSVVTRGSQGFQCPECGQVNHDGIKACSCVRFDLNSVVQTARVELEQLRKKSMGNAKVLLSLFAFGLLAAGWNESVAWGVGCFVAVFGVPAVVNSTRYVRQRRRLRTLSMKYLGRPDP